MKRFLATVLAVCLACQAWMSDAAPVYGAGIQTGPQEKAAAAEDVTGKDAAVSADTAESALEVEVRSSRAFPLQGDVTAVLLGKVSEESKTLRFDGGESLSLSARFDAAPGDYTVVVRADKFADYAQEIHVEAGWISKILVCTEKMEIAGDAASGWLRPGDVTKDGQITKEDTDMLLAAIRRGENTSQFDLNGDGKTDIVDLQYIVQSMEEDQKSQVEKHALLRAASPAEGTSFVGNMQEFLNHTGTLGLQTAEAGQNISASHPVGMDFVLADDKGVAPKLGGMTIYAPAETEENGSISSEITEGTAEVTYVDENGEEKQMQIPSLVPAAAAVAFVDSVGGALEDEPMALSAASVTVEADGSLVLDFGSQIAVKRVTITITGTKKTEPLVQIAKVEFVNDMQDRIPEPVLDIPTLDVPVSENEGLTISWNAQNNITGYEVYVSGPVKKQEEIETQIVRVSNTQHRISSINDKPIKNFAKYTLKVRSINGDWSSPWSNEQIGEPKPSSLPDPVDNVTTEGGYRTIRVSWKSMSDSNGYMVYYKKYADSEFRPVVEGFQPVKEGTGKINGTQYTITGLEDGTKYSVHVIGWNELGWGRPSINSVAETKSIEPPMLPQYKLLNTSNGAGKVTAHVTAAVYGGSGDAAMMGSPLDKVKGSAFGLVDNDYGSFWSKSDWDDGVSYPGKDKGMTISLDQEYQMNFLTFAAADQKMGVNAASIGYWNLENPNSEQTIGAKLLEKMDKNNNPFYIVKFAKTIKANKIRICLGRTFNSRDPMMVGEIRFYEYDSLEDDIMALYEDEMHTTLRADVTAAAIDALQARLEKEDPSCKEKHPLYKELSLELETAREILKSNLEPAYQVDPSIRSQKDGHLGFGGLNAWQPLGKTAYAGESLLVYVGHNTKRTGDAASLQLVFTQHHSEANALAKAVSLKVGRNEITVPKVTSNDYERGGQVYIAYTGNSDADRYAIRISGGCSIPALSVYQKTGEERTAAIRAYVEALENYITDIKDVHDAKHKGNESVDYAYDQTLCVLNATDIMMDEMMYSVPATQVWAGIKNAADKTAKLDKALKAMEDTMTLFYQHKGLSDNAGTARGNNARPSQHLNIRYMRMFSGAFMYASGNHIGVEWGSTPLASAPNDWLGFGWGVAHEIGHDINQGTYAVAEVTNNYFSQLLTGTTRYAYANVYKKVTSGTTGRASNVFTQLALYWQLHLAFDNQLDDRHIYENYEDQFNNIFFARVDTYSRNPAKAPQAGLALNGGSDQNLMRLSCAAANQNILPFFERWGMKPDEATIAYAGKYGKPVAKALYYVNASARDYRVNHPEESTAVKDKDVVTAKVSVQKNQIEVDIAANQEKELILGYEVSRSMFSNGAKKKEVIGFVPIDTAESTVYTDTIYSINNRVMEYEVRAVDKYLNYSNSAYAGSGKIQTDGVLDKSEWTVETNMTSKDDIAVKYDEESPDGGYSEDNPESVPVQTIHSIDRIIDNDKTTDLGTYHGVSEGGMEIMADLHKTSQITALKYKGDPLTEATVEVSIDGMNWVTVKENFKGLTGGTEKTIWFDSVKEDARAHWIGTYDARYVRLTSPAKGNISIQEIEICGPSGDNLEFMTASNGTPAIGVSSTDYHYGSKEGDVIPEGSLILTGIYKGNPAYNMVILYDTEGNAIGAKDGKVNAKQVIFAEVPKEGNLGETSDGTWVYYVEPGNWDEEGIKALKGVRGELYRVDDALTLEGERIVSDTKVIPIPDVLPKITLTQKLPE